MTRQSGNTLIETAMFAVVGSARRQSDEPAPDAPPESGATRAPWIGQALEGAVATEVQQVALRPGDPVPGTRYVIERWLGDGGMGVVFEARHVDIDRKVALKVLRHEFCRKPSVMQQFRDEARIASRIGSDHIAEVSDFAELPDGRLMFVMELLQGGTVGRELEKGVFEPGRVIGILRQVCKALAAAHGAGVVHRDLKPDNIALHVHHGRHDFVKVLDFGISLVMSEADAATHLAAGTPSYLAPEVVVGGRIDHRVDIYAAGCTAYEMLTGRPPFEADTMEAVLRAQVEDQPVPPHELRREIPQALSAVVMRCLAKAAADRYPSMVELEAALCEAQAAARVHTSWDDLELPDIDPERRVALLRAMPDLHGRPAGVRRSWIAAGLVAIALFAAGAWVIDRPPPEQRERAPIDAFAVAAHEAAARSYFVYPPPEAPGTPTALNVVLELERRSMELGSAAATQARQLREEFAATLIRLGDDYWEREGGMPFAIDYYAEALMFVPDHEHASSRVILTPGQLATLRVKAETSTFSHAELVAAEPLIALADPDPERRGEKVAAMQRRQPTRAATTDESLARLDTRSRSSKTAVVATPAAKVMAGAPSSATAATPSEPPVSVPRENTRDRAGAAALVSEGERARDRGRLADAQRAFERALAADSSSDGALIGLSDVQFHKGEYARAASYARKAIRLAPRKADYRIKLGDAYFKSFRYQDARNEYREAQALGHPGALGRIAKVDAKD